MITQATLDGIKVLFCAPGSLAIYGIPYQMRADVRQEPRHLYHSPHASAMAGWVYLGFLDGSRGLGDTPEERDLIVAYAAQLKAEHLIPERPYEWTDLVREGFARAEGEVP